MSDVPFIIGSDGSRREGRVARSGENRSVHIETGELAFIRINHQCRLQFGNTEVIIESPFSLHVGDHEYQLEPADRANLGPLLALYPNSLIAATVDRQATLRLDFESGAAIVVRQDPLYEAWQISGPDNSLVVCMPGTAGDLAIWS